MKQVLIIDDRKTTQALLRAAEQWAELLGARITLLSVVDDSLLRDTTRVIGALGKVTSAIEEEFLRDLERDIKRTLSALKMDSSVDLILKVGTPIEEIKNFIDVSKPVLTILSPNLRSGVLKIATEITHYSRASSFLVTSAFEKLAFGRVLVSVDNMNRDAPAVEASLYLGEKFGGRLFLLKVVDLNSEVFINAPDLLDRELLSSQKMLDGIVDEATRRGIQAEAILREGDTEETVQKMALSLGPDVIVLGSSSRSWFQRFVLGSVSENLLKAVQCPILIVKNELFARQ